MDFQTRFRRAPTYTHTHDAAAIPELLESAAIPNVYEVEDDRRFRLDQLSHDSRQSQSHELSAVSPARTSMSMSIDATMDPSCDSEDDLTLHELKARRAAVTAERERLKRMAQLHDEEQRLGTAIAWMERGSIYEGNGYRGVRMKRKD